MNLHLATCRNFKHWLGGFDSFDTGYSAKTRYLSFVFYVGLPTLQFLRLLGSILIVMRELRFYALP